MQIYEAISFQEIVDAGGSTYPWRVLVVDEHKHIRPFLAKIFTKRQLIQQHAIAKELFGNVLAREFELNVPEAGLVNFQNCLLSINLNNQKRIYFHKEIMD
ncbi:hypothetical protein VB776_04040 [Arcicella sp. DC2W]|uniref:Uncharacterized protein n=1 Tax=Arcicella gelida TaxID=2984195 RepID=A0ABU5S0T0_9BACT|nr:hypothetical protein [Arcicella sp. DC2W]MEA5402074.1 hypothetical protein [Arcicella sp. DC2W]